MATQETETPETLSALLHEDRHFPPDPAFAAAANAQPQIYEQAAEDRLGFWAEQARQLTWETPFTEVLDWQPPDARWFHDGRLNVSVNCLDRHLAAGNGDRVAFHWYGDPAGEQRTLTYAELTDSVCRAANALTDLGVRAGETVAIYMPMIPETVVAMLACARIGAPHTVVFGGFSADALATRIQDAEARTVITADGGFRRGAPSPLKPAVDAALTDCPDVRTVLVVRRTGEDVDWTDGRDVWWHDTVEQASAEHQPEAFEAEHPLFILYTSGTTAKPKGILHTSGGYLTQVSATHRLIFDLKPDDVYWCAADVGWVTGHSYIVYGPLTNGATSVMFEGVPHPGDKERWWQIIEERRVSILYTAPTTIRTFMKWGRQLLAGHDLSSLRVLGTVGEPINPEAWIWYREVVGGGTTPIVDTWWQTETGGIAITPLPGIAAAKPGAAMRPFPGMSAEVVTEQGQPVGNGRGGLLVLTEPWPGMLRGIWGDHDRYWRTYWEKFDGRYYFAGDGAKKDDDGDLWLLGRVDDVMNISGHRISTTEVEHALVGHHAVAEAAVVGAQDPTTGQAIVAFVTVKGSVADDESSGEAFLAELREHVSRQIGRIAKPRQILVTPELPKTRSGKIMRRLLQDVAEHRELGDVTTLADPTVVDAISQRMDEHAAAD